MNLEYLCPNYWHWTRALEPYVSMYAISQPLTYPILSYLSRNNCLHSSGDSGGLIGYHFTTHSQPAAVDRLLAKKQPALFVHNSLHDIEFLWVVLCGIPSTTSVDEWVPSSSTMNIRNISRPHWFLISFTFCVTGLFVQHTEAALSTGGDINPTAWSTTPRRLPNDRPGIHKPEVHRPYLIPLFLIQFMSYRIVLSISGSAETELYNINALNLYVMKKKTPEIYIGKNKNTNGSLR